jgi:hypothetical protein
MRGPGPEKRDRRRSALRQTGTAAVAVVLAMTAAACAQRPEVAPDPRPIVNRQGSRLALEDDRAQEIFRWVDAQIDEIEQNPSFWVISSPSSSDLLPWETLDLTATGDSATVQFPTTVPDVSQVYQIYAHLHITRVRGTIADWLPGADTLTGWGLEVAMVDRMAEAWLLGRASYTFTPYPPIDQLVYASEAGMLEPLLLSLRGFEYPDARDAWLEANPNGEAEFRTWYEATLGGVPEPIAGGN